jgi:DNA-binding NarL/FixJ family response regulator
VTLTSRALMKPRANSPVRCAQPTSESPLAPTTRAPRHRRGRSPDRRGLVTARLNLVAQGRSNAEIADQLYISLYTAKTHVSRILTKLGARDRAQLVIVAYETGLISPGK